MMHGQQNIKKKIYNVVFRSVYRSGLCGVYSTLLPTAGNNKCASVLAVCRPPTVVTLTLTTWCMWTD
jgi:hypothetical protein